MFPARFFPLRFFPSRFFPKSGVPPVTGAVRIVVNGVDRTDYLYYQQSASWNLMRGSRGTATIPLVIEPGDTLAPQVGETVKLYDPATTRVWSGTVDGIRIQWLGDDGWRVITLTCVSLEQLFDTSELDKIEYTNTSTCGAAFADLVSRSGVTAVGLGTISAGPAIQSLQVSNVVQGFNDLALLAGFVWYVDPADELIYFHAPGARAAAFTLDDDVLWETLDYKQNRVDFRDTQRTQLPGVAQSPITATYPGDNTTTAFTLPSVPSYIIRIDILPAGRGILNVAWIPGTDQVNVIPAMLIGNSVVVQYAEVSGQTSVTNPDAALIGVGSKQARYTKTRTYTAAGGLQETTAIIARYSMLPATLEFLTDRPGLAIARALTIALTSPDGSSDQLNGIWLIREVDAAIIPGMDQKAEPFGHFRYTIRLVNTAATAIFQGDGATTDFSLPEIPGTVPSIRVNAPGLHVAQWFAFSDLVTVTPALTAGESVSVDYTGANTPDVPSFVSTWENMPGGGGGTGSDQTPAPSGLEPTAEPAVALLRTISIRDTTVRDDATEHTTVYAAGFGLRVLGVLRLAITADLSVRIKKSNVEIITVTIPQATAVDDVLEWTLAQGSPALLDLAFSDKEVLTCDILESDGSKDKDGIAQFTVEWTRS